VTRAVLPVMRKQRSGHIVTITSTAGIVGGETTSAYAAAKFGAEGWMESLAPEVAPFGIKTTLVEPGFFRTELLEPASTTFAELSIDDYAARRAENRAWWESMNGKQEGDPAKLLEHFGYGTWWIGASPRVPDVRPVLEATSRLVAATGILNVWANEPAETAAATAAVRADFPGRLMLGIGVGHREATTEYHT